MVKEQYGFSKKSKKTLGLEAQMAKPFTDKVYSVT